MILYLNTSAFLKLYLEEPDSARMREVIARAGMVCTHLITYAEMRAGLAQAVRMKRLPTSELSDQIRALEADWQTLELIGVDEPLVRRAGELAESHGLRGYDSVHLAAAERALDASGWPAEFFLAAFDNGLRTGAEAIGLKVLP